MHDVVQLLPHRGKPGVRGQMSQIVRMTALQLDMVVDLVDHHLELAGVDSVGAHGAPPFALLYIDSSFLSRTPFQRKMECEFFRE